MKSPVITGGTKPELRQDQPAGCITVRRLLPAGMSHRWWTGPAVWLVDRLLAIRQIDRLYASCRPGSDGPENFIRRVMEALQLDARVEGGPLPDQGPLLVVANHPQGGPEALALLHHLLAIRPDVKVLSNGMLGLIAEMQPLLVHINPLRREMANVIALRHCNRHLQSGGALVVFPAGRVSSWQADERRITDAPWSELVGQLVRRNNATLLPVYCEGEASALFIHAGRILDRLKLLLLPRELLGAGRRPLTLKIGTPVAASLTAHLDAGQITRFARVLVYNLAGGGAMPSSTAVVPMLPRLAAASPGWLMRREVDSLPSSQQLLRLQNFRVFYARLAQCPLTVRQITVERERTFRRLQEGSGSDLDTDQFDHTYVHLFVYDDDRDAIVGAYRIGHASELIRAGGLDAIYLSRMFEFDPAFFVEAPKIELGRSFVVPEYQKRFSSLLLLWQGIAAYLRLFPECSHLYGTVSLSRTYDQRSVSMVCDLLIRPTKCVHARFPLVSRLAREWDGVRQDFGEPDLRDLDLVMRGAGNANAVMPVLLRQYFSVGARFLAVGIDRNFRDTPGLLLQLDTNQVSGRAARAILQGRRGGNAAPQTVPT